jgi:tetratricopeptide (TPR) repeat protein
MPKKTALLPLILACFVLSSTAASAQTQRYPQLAQAMARDGFARRQNAYLAKIAPESREANRLGFLAYQKKDYETAVGRFGRAIELDKTNMFAHFNLACTLSLALGGDPEALKNIRLHLAAAATLDVHWIYKAFLDADLNPVRGRLMEFDIYYPCPGDCCPDQSYFLHPDGTVEYSTSLPDLSGLPHASPAPHIQARGWYMLIGDCFLVYVPGRAGVLARYSTYAAMYDDGEETRDELLFVPFTRNAAGKIEEVEQPSP